ncbi:MAG: PAP2 family protein, partial [Cytophagaceae bacterium]|nr:PAP2 family protein [Cytophagaceae bacterium]
MKIILGFRKKILASLALFSIELIALWIIFFGSLFVFLFISKEIFYVKQEEFDKKVFVWVHHLISPTFTTVMKSITFFASREFISVFSFLIFIYFLFIKKHAWYTVTIPVVAIGSITVNLILKHLFDRPRPF